MERTIFVPQSSKNESKITSNEVDALMQEKGIIIVYDGDEIVGSVVFWDSLFYLGLKDVSDTYYSLSDIIKDYPSLIFKFID